MGLDTSHNCWHGPYSSFNNFRYDLARQIGIDLNDYAGYRGEGTKKLSSIPHDIMPLLNHSDCDGILSPKECKQVAKGLDDILLKLPDSKAEIKSCYFKEKVIQFRDGCIEAHKKNESVDFH